MNNETNIKEIIELISAREAELSAYTKMTEGHWIAMIQRLENLGIATGNMATSCHNEEIWTFLTSLAYASSREEGNSALLKALTDSHEDSTLETKQWIEALPIPPRSGEGNTNLDLAMGSIQTRDKTIHGIEYDGSERPLVFCEMKWFSDLSYGVSGDPHRNQLIRVIENAITFQRDGNYPSTVHVTLVTPREFKDRQQASRFYHTKFHEYSDEVSGIEMMLSELNSCRLKPYPNQGWKYPDVSTLKGRIERLKLHWVTFEELITNAPKTELAELVRQFEASFNRSGGSTI